MGYVSIPNIVMLTKTQAYLVTRYFGDYLRTIVTIFGAAWPHNVLELPLCSGFGNSLRKALQQPQSGAS